MNADLAWLRSVLWGRSEAVRVLFRSGSAEGLEVVERFRILPRSSRPRILVPFDNPMACRSGLCQYNDGMTRRSRVAKAVLAQGMRLRPVQRMFPDQIVVATERGRRGELEAALLEHRVRRLMGRHDLQFSISFGKPRPNRKPVLQALTPEGAVVGYAKVGWNELTGRLVRNEAAILEALASRRVHAVQVPRLLFHERWRGLEISGTTPLPHKLALGAARRDPPVVALRALIEAFGLSRRRLSDCEYWRQIRQRIRELATNEPQNSTRRRLALVADSLNQRRGALSITSGFVHGDWAPWNMSGFHDRLLIWDWERAALDAPIGLDLVHFAFQVAFHFERRGVRDSILLALRRTEPYLRLLGVARPTGEILGPLYLLDLAVRHEEAREGATGTGVSTRILDALTSTFGPQAGVR